MDQANIIIENGTILCMDKQNSIIENGFLAITGDLLSYIGTEKPHLEAGKTIDAKGGLVLPGLLNAHTHAAMSLFRGLADDLPLMEWLNNYIFPVEKRINRDFVYAGAMLACAEMIMSGTTTFCDMYLFEEEVARAAKKAGMRCLVGEVLYDFPSPNYGPIESGLKYTESMIKRWQDDHLVSVAVEPHSLFTCSPDLLTRANELALKYDVPVIVHLAETRSEVAEIQDRYGRSPVQHLNSLGLLGPHLIADHCVHLDEKDILALAENRVRVVHNPESNMKLASGIAPVPNLLSNGVTVGLGTDGCASNNNLDLFTEMDMAAKLHKVNSMDPTLMDATTVLRMATSQGACALGLGKIIGTLEIGKKADVIIVDTNKPHLTPMYNPYSHLVYAARGSDVSHSIINGKLVMENRILLTLDLDRILTLARHKSEEIRKWLSH
jgi:5-methylthioadenosine/S-adenosylhomocysteine deaminase